MIVCLPVIPITLLASHVLGSYAPIPHDLSSPNDRSGRGALEITFRKICSRDGSLFIDLMAYILVLLLSFSNCLGRNVLMVPWDRVKVVEDYVVSAKFDERKDLPQLHDRNLPQGIMTVETKPDAINRKLGKVDTLEERDLLVHHHHLPPPVPPVPPPPPPHPVALALPSSVFAVGFITFLILLNTLYTSFLLTAKPKHSLLGSLAKPLGRRRRFVKGNFDWKGSFKEKYLTGDVPGQLPERILKK